MPALSERQHFRAELSDLVRRLVAEYSDLLPAAAVRSCVLRSCEELRRAGLRAGLAVATEAMARHRLDGLLPAHVGLAGT